MTRRVYCLSPFCLFCSCSSSWLILFSWCFSCEKASCRALFCCDMVFFKSLISLDKSSVIGLIASLIALTNRGSVKVVSKSVFVSVEVDEFDDREVLESGADLTAGPLVLSVARDRVAR